MRYRIHPKTGDRISEIGLGSAYLYESDHDEAVHALQTAYEGGINYFDLAAGDARAFPLWGMPWDPSAGMSCTRSISEPIIPRETMAGRWTRRP